jgi:hypothetical protein
MTQHVTVLFAEGLRQHPLTPATPGAKGGKGNHAIWTLGHLTVIEANLPNIVVGKPNPLEKWWPIFGTGSEPKYEPEGYPSLDELLALYREHRAQNLKLLDEIGDAGLDRKPVNIPQGFEKEMRTIGHTFTTIAVHNMMHCGQLADIRRVAGVPRFM